MQRSGQCSSDDGIQHVGCDCIPWLENLIKQYCYGLIVYMMQTKFDPFFPKNKWISVSSLTNFCCCFKTKNFIFLSQYRSKCPRVCLPEWFELLECKIYGGGGALGLGSGTRLVGCCHPKRFVRNIWNLCVKWIRVCKKAETRCHVSSGSPGCSGF